MKHIFAYVDKLMILLKFYPNKPKTHEDFRKISKLIVQIKVYTFLLQQLINAHKIKNSLKKLQESKDHDIEDWANKVSVVFDKLDQLLNLLIEDNKKISDALYDEPYKLPSLISDLALGMYLTGLHNEEEHLKELRNLMILKEHELEKALGHKTRLKELNQWHEMSELSEEEQILAHEKFFLKLLS